MGLEAPLNEGCNAFAGVDLECEGLWGSIGRRIRVGRGGRGISGRWDSIIGTCIDCEIVSYNVKIVLFGAP